MTEVITKQIEEKPVIQIDFENDLIAEIEKFGAIDASACVNCGNCTAICGLTSEGNADFPRKIIRYMQLGQKDKILSSTAPWDCYYCGECSDTCPRGANPGEIMAGMRRWMIGEYDSSGKAKKLYTDHRANWFSIFLWFIFPIFGMLLVHAIPGFGAEIVTDSVQLNKFAPVYVIWVGTLVLGLYKAKFLLTGIFNMTKSVMSEKATGMKIPLSIYISEFKTMVLHLTTQIQWKKCGKNTGRWFKHLLLVTAYASMFVLIFGLLWWFQTDEIYPITHPQRWVGYYATAIMVFVSLDMIYGRFRKREQIHKHSHHTDWMFPIFIFLVAVTGILVHIFRLMLLPWPTYIIYVIHLMVASTMLSNEVGVGKWTHIFYRPMAQYFDAVKRKAEESLGTSKDR